MKAQIIALLLLFAGTSTAIAQNITADKYATNRHVTTVTLNRGMLNLIPGGITKIMDITSVGNNVESLRILTTSKRCVGRRITRSVRQEVNTPKYSELVGFTRGHKTYSVAARQEDGSIREASLLISQKHPRRRTTLIVLNGNFSLTDLKSLPSYLK